MFEEMSDGRLVFILLSSNVYAFACLVRAAIDIYRFRTSRLTEVLKYKRWAMLWNALNWSLVGLVYLYDAISEPSIFTIRPYFRVAWGLVLASEIAYYGDVVTEFMVGVKEKAANGTRNMGRNH